MKTTKLFFMAALALMTAACSNDDNDLTTQQPAKAEGIPFTATISVGESGTTRALSESGSTLVATWAVNDEVALIHNGVIDKVTVASVSGGVATISGTITSATDGADVTVIYPYDAADGTTGNVKAGLLHAQSGATLADVASKYDVRKGTGNLKVSGTASLNGNVSLTNQFAIMKLTLANDAKNLCIMADDITIAGATLGTEGTEFYVAVPAVSSKTVTIVANDESNNCYYFSKAGVSLAAGRYYQSSPTMTALDGDNSKPLYKITATSSVTIPDGKTVVLSGVTISEGSINCSGNANIILLGSNTVTGASNNAAIQIGGSGTTLTITGSGSLTAQGGGGSAGIGTNFSYSSAVTGGKIVINGGTVIATGGLDGAGIGTGMAYQSSNTCDDITINGGTVTATGGTDCAAIGTGLAGQSSNTCGDITIGAGVTSVTATKGNNSPNSIGKGRIAYGTQTCGTITFDATQVFDGSAWLTDPMAAGTYGGLNLAITTTTNTDDTWTLTPAP